MPEKTLMLVDPSGNRMQSSIAIETAGRALEDGTGRFTYLVEACDPCEGNNYSYEIQGVLVSDFITPHFYDTVTASGTRYSFTGAVTKPRQILPGGYISFVNQKSDEWQQILYLGSTPQLKPLEPAGGEWGIREWVDNEMEKRHHQELDRAIRHIAVKRAKHLKERRKKLNEIAMIRAKHYERASH